MTEEQLSIRPVIPSLKITEEMSAEERFQNQTLRPIIKMQHDLLMTHFQHYLMKRKCVLADLSEKERVETINASFHKDIQFRNTLQGMIIGHFNVDEYQQYKKMASDTNKRILQITKERVLSNLNELLCLA